MDTPKIAEISNRAGKLIDGLGPFRRLYVLCASGVVIVLVALSFSYMPLAVKLYRAATRLNELEAELLRQRGVVAMAGKSDTKVEVMPCNEIHLAIAELTAKGRDIGRSFSSIVSQTLRKTTRPNLVWDLYSTLYAEI